jgi:hypothetical protein
MLFTFSSHPSFSVIRLYFGPTYVGLPKLYCGRAIAQAVSRWLPTAVARVRARVLSSGICGGQSGAGADFLRVLRFPLPIFIQPNFPSPQSPRAGTVGYSVADVPSGSSMDPTPHYAN